MHVIYTVTNCVVLSLPHTYIVIKVGPSLKKNVCFELLPGSIQTQVGGSGNFCLFFKLEGQLIKDWLKLKI